MAIVSNRILSGEVLTYVWSRVTAPKPPLRETAAGSLKAARELAWH